MAKSRKAAAPEARDELAASVEALAAEVRVLREAIDELREEIQYATNNLFDRPEPPLPHRRITSMPQDPTANNFGERLNAYTSDELPADDASERTDSDTPPDRPAGRLF